MVGMGERNKIVEVIRDAEMFEVLTKREQAVPEAMVLGMRYRYSQVAFPTVDVPIAGEYSNLITLAQLGEKIGLEDIDTIKQFREEIEKYMTKPSRR